MFYVLKKEHTKPYISIAYTNDDSKNINAYLDKFSKDDKKTLFVFDSIVEPKYLQKYGVYDAYINDAGQLVKWTTDELAVFLSENKKSEKIQSINNCDYDTSALIKRGFEFDGHVFSLSIAAQSNWNRLLMMYTLGLFSNTVISTKNDDEYVLTVERVKEFAQAYNTSIETVLKQNRIAKNNINKSY